jgi:ABC-type multidrug transport system fused ATPase/permease subunit
MTISILLAGFVFAFITGWLMTLVVLAIIPALGIAGYFYFGIIGNKDKK